MAGYRIVADPTEASWRADWAKCWDHARKRGWTEVRGEVLADGTPGGGRIICLREDADCTERLDRAGTMLQDYRAILMRLQEIGTIRGWLYDDDDDGAEAP